MSKPPTPNKEAAAWEKGMHVRQLQFCTHALSAQVLAKRLHLDDFMIFTFACNRALTDTWDLLLHKDIKRFKENRKMRQRILRKRQSEANSLARFNAYNVGGFFVSSPSGSCDRVGTRSCIHMNSSWS